MIVIYPFKAYEISKKLIYVCSKTIAFYNWCMFLSIYVQPSARSWTTLTELNFATLAFVGQGR